MDKSKITPTDVINHFRNHRDIAVLRVAGVYEIWTRHNGKLHKRMAAHYKWSDLKYWARQFNIKKSK